MTKIIRLATTNYKRLSAAEIIPDPDGNLVIVAGKNGQGKTSVLDSITAALGGVDAKATPKPIRDGEDSAQIVLETEDLIVTRRFTASGSTLTVKSHDGATYSKGQAKLDDLLGKLSLDPLAFTKLSDRDQLATLLDLVDLPFDPDKLATERKGIFDQRAEANRDAKSLAAQLAGYPTFDVDNDYEEVSVSALIGEYRDAQAAARSQESDRDKLHDAEQTVAAVSRDIEEVEAEIDRLQAEVVRLKGKRARFVDHVASAAGVIAKHEALPDLDAIQAKIDGAEQINATARQYSDYLAIVSKHADAVADADKLTTRLTEIDQRKTDGLAAATFPIDGLGFDETGVTHNGVPFKQASGAEQLRVSLAMAIALNPKMRVIRIADGSLLDSDSLALVEAAAKEHDFQVWIEMVGDGDGRGIIIEDGQVA